MRLLCLTFLGLLIACSRSPSETHSIDHISALIGDESFTSLHHRSPTEADDIDSRIRTHLLHVETILRATENDRRSEEERSARNRSLDALHAYAEAGQFPDGESVSGYLPTFIDDNDRRCAVAYLVEQSEGPQVIQDINETYRNAFVREIKSPLLLAWVSESGLTLDEVALIQPAYPPRHDDIRHRVLLVNDLQVGASDNSVRQVSGVEAQLQWNTEHHNLNTTIYGLEAFVGLADLEDLAYRLHAFAGWGGGFTIPKEVIDGVRRTPWSTGPHAYGLRIGAGVDEAGGNVGRALTLPMEAFYSFPSSEQTRLALHLGPVLTIAGDDRAHGFQGALKIRWKRAFSWLGLDRWDVHMGLAYQRKASANIAGIQIGLGKYRDDGWYITE